MSTIVVQSSSVEVPRSTSGTMRETRTRTMPSGYTKPRRNSRACIFSREYHHASVMRTASFANSEGCNVKPPMPIQRRDPLMRFPFKRQNASNTAAST